jgi:predicted regulator of Ras-like GTPase activity (Roadblock/LC7/MglB family)
MIADSLPSHFWEKPAAPLAPMRSPEPAMPAPGVRLPPPGAPEIRPTISVTASEPQGKPLELRPSKDASTSTTLRAVVLGGNAPATPANAPDTAGQILAPRTAPATPPVILGPSVVPSADGSISPALRAAPDLEGLQNLFMTGAALDLAGVAALAAALPGVRSCVITGTAGTATAGDFSCGVSEGEVRAVSADLARIGGAATDTLHRGESDIVIFLHDEVSVAAVVAAGGFVPGVRERLARVAELLAGAKPAR